jgi:hypothetical protein
VTVSWVATASRSDAESSTRRTATSPAARASSIVTRKTRSGSAEHAAPPARYARTTPSRHPRRRHTASAGHRRTNRRPPGPSSPQALQHHRQDRRRDRAAAVMHIHVGEQLVTEQPVPFGVQQPIDRPLRQVGLAVLHRDVEQLALPFDQPQRHRPPRAEKHISVILRSGHQERIDQRQGHHVPSTCCGGPGGPHVAADRSGRFWSAMAASAPRRAVVACCHDRCMRQ